MLYEPRHLSSSEIAKGFEIPQKNRIFLGFDAFADEICALVKKRTDAHHYTRVKKLADFGQSVVRAAGNSANFELVALETRIGGNAANLARALCAWTYPVHLAATIGAHGTIEPLFLPLAQACAEVFSLGPSSHTDALEFEDGKLLLGKMDPLLHLSTLAIFEAIGTDTLTRQLDACDLFASVNWTMLADASSLWSQLRAKCMRQMQKKRRIFLVDFADPRKRSIADLQRALCELANWNAHFDVILSLNPAESQQVSAALLLTVPRGSTLSERQSHCQAICRAMDVAAIVEHSTDCATVGTKDQALSVASPYCQKPATTTGGGDHFNAGLCHGLLHQLHWPEVLAYANATSGCFVRSAKSPTLRDLQGFFEQWRQ